MSCGAQSGWGSRVFIAMLGCGCFRPVETAPQFPTAPEPTNEVRLENLVAIPMRDGVNLYADVYRPVGKGRYPVIVGRTPYSTERHATPAYRYPNAYEAPLFFSRRGYVFVYQDTRGRHESEGQWEPFRNEILDGYDTIEWAAEQPWSNGKVGMQGVSYEGTVQWLAAMAAPPHLVTIVPSVASTSIYHNWITSNGAWRLSFNLDWGAIRMESRVMQNLLPHSKVGGPTTISLATILGHLPITGMQSLAGRNAAFFKDWIAHPDYDEYWQVIDAEEAFNRIGIPVLNFGGWFDLFRQGTLHGYTGMRARGRTAIARNGTSLVIGPWGHFPSRRVGLLDFGEAAFVDQNALALEWFDYWLKGIDNGVGDRSPVRVFVMGADEWRDEDDFPPARARFCKLYLHSGGRANTLLGDGRLYWEPPDGDPAPDRYVYDPEYPAGAGGGGTGGTDQRLVEERDDVLVYTSDPLTDSLEVIGPLEVTLYASSNAPDTDFVVRLVDVQLDGRAISIAEGILRARYRESTTWPTSLKPESIYPMSINLAGTAIVFRKGHRIRVDITSSAFPAFDRHPNTSHPFGTSPEITSAVQAAYHTAQYPSHIILPVTSTSAALPTQSCQSTNTTIQR